MMPEIKKIGKIMNARIHPKHLVHGRAEGEADTLRLEVASMVPREELLAVQVCLKLPHPQAVNIAQIFFKFAQCRLGFRV
jgi:hypothetical protein